MRSRVFELLILIILSLTGCESRVNNSTSSITSKPSNDTEQALKVSNSVIQGRWQTNLKSDNQGYWHFELDLSKPGAFRLNRKCLNGYCSGWDNEYEVSGTYSKDNDGRFRFNWVGEVGVVDTKAINFEGIYELRKSGSNLEIKHVFDEDFLFSSSHAVDIWQFFKV